MWLLVVTVSFLISCSGTSENRVDGNVQKAIERASVYLEENNLDWGNPIQVKLTTSTVSGGPAYQLLYKTPVDEQLTLGQRILVVDLNDDTVMLPGRL